MQRKLMMKTVKIDKGIKIYKLYSCDTIEKKMSLAMKAKQLYLENSFYNQ